MAANGPRTRPRTIFSGPGQNPPPSPPPEEAEDGFTKRATAVSSHALLVQNESDAEDAAIQASESFYTIHRVFHSTRRKHGDIGAKDIKTILQRELKDQARIHLANVEKGGDDDHRSFLHFLLKAPSLFRDRLPLVRWAMDTYQDLYLQGVDSGKSILHLAADKCKTENFEFEYLSTLVELYPVQIADILKKSKDYEKLLLDILPFIRTVSGPDFLELFGAHPDTPKIKPCDCPACVEDQQTGSPDATYGVATTVATPGSPSSPNTGNHISKEEVGDIVKLRWKQPSESGPSPAAHPRLRKPQPSQRSTQAAVGGLDKGEKTKDEETPLHLAAAYVHACDDACSEKQFNLVKHLYFWHPEALEKTNAQGQSAYLHRVAGSETGRPPSGDPIVFFLKDQIMHLDDRDLVLELLYGKPDASQPQNPRGAPPLVAPPALNSAKGQLEMRQEREIHLDLRELQMSAPSTVKKEDLLEFIRKLDFEDILQYVQIPRHPFRPWGASRSPTDGMEAEPNKEGAGRKDFESIFELLSGKGVRKILRLIVDDDDTCPHQDEVTEGLSKFEIEEFQWRKLDISSMVLRHGVPQVRTLHLLSSGNHSVLRDWSSTDGLCNLSLLETVYLRIYWKIEPREKLEGYARDFINRMVRNCPQVRSLDVQLEPLTSKTHEEWLIPNSLVTTNKWLQTMQKFASLVGNVIKIREAAAATDSGNQATPQAAHAPRDYQHEVRVAVLDDGIDWYFANEIGCSGRSFYSDKRHDFDRQKNWYSSSTDHGTLMAALVRKICPNVSLYVARLDQTETERGVFQPTPESAVKAIRWAILQNVHIISMSWTIPGEYAALDQAVKAARDAGIIMFGAASDQGAHNASKPYMAKLSTESTSPVICIGGAREAGYGDKKAMAEAEFFFPGQTHGIPEPLPHIKSNFGGQIGSSVATALATGLTALIMLLVNISPKYGGHTPSPPHAAAAGTATTVGGGGASSTHLYSPCSALSPTISSSSYRGMLQQPRNIRRVFNWMLNSTELLSSRREPAEYSRTDSVIAVDRFFEHEGLKRRLDSYMGPDRSKKAARLFDGRLETILQPLIQETKRKEDLSFPDSDLDEEY